MSLGPRRAGALQRGYQSSVALLLIFEEWGWERLSAGLAHLARLPLWGRVERWIASLPPWGALATFAVPAAALLPIKLLALFFIGRGHTFTGLVVLLAAKVLGTAIVARLFTLTQPTLMRLAWFARWYPRWKAWKDRVMDQVRLSPVWVTGGRWKAWAKQRWAALRDSLKP